MPEDFNIGGLDPDWIGTGGISGGEDRNYDDSDDGSWDTNATTEDEQAGEAVGKSQGGITVQTGPFSGGYTGIVNGVTTITLDENLFLIQDNGGGEVLISLNTTTCP